MRSADQSMCEGFPGTAVGIVLDLNAAKKVVQRVAVLYVDGNRRRTRETFIKSRAVKMRREITLDPKIAAKVVNSADLESVKVFAVTEKVIDRAAAVDARVDLPIRISDEAFTLFNIGAGLSECHDRGQQKKANGHKNIFHLYKSPHLFVSNALKKRKPNKSDNA